MREITNFYACTKLPEFLQLDKNNSMSLKTNPKKQSNHLAFKKTSNSGTWLRMKKSQINNRWKRDGIAVQNINHRIGFFDRAVARGFPIQLDFNTREKIKFVFSWAQKSAQISKVKWTFSHLSSTPSVQTFIFNKCLGLNFNCDLCSLNLCEIWNINCWNIGAYNKSYYGFFKILVVIKN